jgi:hypothetical protein
MAMEVAEVGGFTQLSVLRSAEKSPHLVIKDVTAAAWVAPSSLIYSTSPLYGSPGLYRFDCDHMTSTVLVGPRNKTADYPNGTDYFELHAVPVSAQGKLYYYYAPEVDSVDFATFHSPKHLYRVGFDGKHLERVAVSIVD